MVGMKWMYRMAAFGWMAILPIFLTGQEVRRAMVEEIQQVPAQQDEPWQIGGQVFQVLSTTQVVGSNQPSVGDLAIVQFVVRDDKFVATAIQSLGVKVKDLNDGPYVLWKDAATADVLTMNGGKVERKTYQGIAGTKALDGLPEPVKSVRLDPAPPRSPKAVWEQPSRLMAISDLEGNYQNARQFLENNQIIDEKGNWKWGDGHLVLNGDLVDRGRQVTELMWLIYRLERQAREAGGEVHYILGNHEAMVMGGDLRYIHPKYRFVTDQMQVEYDRLFAADTEIGRWWRSKNGVETIGNLLFIHGGYSPKLDQEQLSVDALNQKIREGLAPAQPTGETPGTNPVRHQHGPFWYRGYFERYADSWGGKATDAEIRKILDRHGVDHIVIGHTLVDEVGPLDETGAVIAIDVKWRDREKCQGLLQEGGQLYRVSMDGTREKIELGK
ncbi:MAG: metallophosphoesterase [Mariniblastus sp.]|nr:metallophosphoesterase [Mariniblastus sp.]